MLEARNDQIERPQWMSDSLIEATIETISRRAKLAVDDAKAVELLSAMSQLLEATGLLKLEIEHEDEKVHGVGEGEQP